MRSTLYVTDLDGTLLNSRGELSDFTRNTLCELLADGEMITLASARSIVNIRLMLGDLPLKLPVINFNGAYLSDLHTGQHYHCHSFGGSIAEELYEAVVQHDCAPYLSAFDGSQDRVYYNQVINAGMDWYLEDRRKARDPRLKKVDDLRTVFCHKVVCMTAIHNDYQHLTDLEQRVRNSYGPAVVTHCYENAYSPGWYWLTMQDSRATKAQGIRSLRETFGLEAAELVVFGDHLNDIEMFRLAERAVAVENAVPELKAHATQTIPHHELDSVAHFLREDVAQRRRMGFLPMNHGQDSRATGV